MNVMASECSSGCESGWTSYLEQSFKSGNLSHKSKSSFCNEHRKGKGKEEVFLGDDDDDGEEEDLSMVSDASSGPPHFYKDNGNYSNDHYSVLVPKGATLNKNGGKRHRNEEHQRQKEDHQEDDTASSPLVNFSKNNFAHTNNHASMDESVFHYPQGFTATHFQGGPAFQDQFGLLQSSPSGNHLQGGFKELICLLLLAAIMEFVALKGNGRNGTYQSIRRIRSQRG